jgi:polyketide biosynthesis enoyl-CoA hydratase PksH
VGIVSYETIKASVQDSVCFIRLDRPAANNTVNAKLVAECHEALDACEESVSVIVLSGSPEVFSLGADFAELAQPVGTASDGPGALYDLWLRLATGPYVTISHVRGQANAGGLGFVAASDMVLADDTAEFRLSELLFGLYPACVLPFLIRRIGFQRAHYLTLTTQPIHASQAHAWGLVDAFEPQSENLLRRHLQRLRPLSKVAVRRYKTYVSGLESRPLADLKSRAVAGNLEVFSDPRNIRAITRYVERGVFPWESA